MLSKRVLIVVLLLALISALLPAPVLAWICPQYLFNVSVTGEVSVENASPRDENGQVVSVLVNGVLVGQFAVPALTAHSPRHVLGTVTPGTGHWSWEVVGHSDCRHSGRYVPGEVPPPEDPPGGGLVCVQLDKGNLSWTDVLTVTWSNAAREKLRPFNGWAHVGSLGQIVINTYDGESATGYVLIEDKSGNAELFYIDANMTIDCLGLNIWGCQRIYPEPVARVEACDCAG